MDYFSKNKLLIGAIIVLALMNVATLATLWWMAGQQPMLPRKPGMSPKDYIVSELNFTEEQKQKFDELRKQHRRSADDILMRLKKSKKEFFELLAQPSVADSVVKRNVGEIGELEVSLNMTTFNHFQQVKALCTEQQRAKFDSIIEDVLRMMNAPPRPPDGRRPPPMGEGPPPDGALQPPDERP